MQRAGVKTFLKEKELWLLVVVSLLYFHRVLFLGETFFVRDLLGYFFAHKQLLLEFFRTGELPLWNPYLNGGQVYLANITATVCDPFNLLYLFLPPLRAFNLNIILHIIFGTTFAYLFAREIGLQPLSSFIAGIFFGFCGYTLSLVNLLTHLIAISYLPLMLLGWHRFLRDRSRKWFVITVIVGVIQVFSGTPEINTVSFVSILGWSLVYPYPRCSRVRRVCLWGLLGIFTLGIASIQLLPMVEVFSSTPRGQGFDYAGFSQWSLHLERLPELIFPGFLGYFDQYPDSAYYWGKDLVDTGFPYLVSIYYGGLALVFAFLSGVIPDRGMKLLPRRTRSYLLLLFIISLVCSLGRFLPGFQSLYNALPWIRSLRYPTKIFALGAFPFALLVGYASELYFGPGKDANTRGASRSMIVLLWGGASLFVLLSAAFWGIRDFSDRVLLFFFHQSENEIARSGIRLSLFHATAVWLSVALVYQARHLKRRRWQPWMLAGILTVDLLSAGSRLNPSASQEIWMEPPAAVSMIQNSLDDGRLYQFERDLDFMSAPTRDIFWKYWLNFELLRGLMPMFYRIPAIFHLELVELISLHIIKLSDITAAADWPQRLPLLSASGVTLILTNDQLALPGVRLIGEIPNRSIARFYLYRNETAAKRAEFVTEWILVQSDDDALKEMFRPGYDPRQHVVLQEAEPMIAERSSPPRQTTTASQLSQCNSAHLEKRSAKLLSMSWRVSNQCDGYLVFTEPFYPEWRISVDGRPVPVFRANLAFSAIFLPAGEHMIERRYQPNAVFYGILCSLLFCGVLCWVTYKKWILWLFKS